MPSNAWIAPSRPSATNTAVPLAISSRHICGRARPLAALAQDVRHARHARDLGVRVGARGAQLQRGVQRLLGAAVVGRVVERDAEALVELGGDGGEVVLERERQAVAHGLQAGRVLAVLGAGQAFEPEGADAEVEPVCGLRLGLGRPRQLDRLAVARGEPPLVGDREVLDRSFGRAAGRGERVGGRAARGDRRLAVALELVHGREASLGLGHGAFGRGAAAISSRHARVASASSPESWQQRA